MSFPSRYAIVRTGFDDYVVDLCHCMARERNADLLHEWQEKGCWAKGTVAQVNAGHSESVWLAPAAIRVVEWHW